MHELLLQLLIGDVCQVLAHSTVERGHHSVPSPQRALMVERKPAIKKDNGKCRKGRYWLLCNVLSNRETKALGHVIQH